MSHESVRVACFLSAFISFKKALDFSGMIEKILKSVLFLSLNRQLVCIYSPWYYMSTLSVLAGVKYEQITM